MTKKEFRSRIKRIILTSLFLILSTYLWFSFSPLRSQALDNTYFKQAFLQIEEVGNGVLLEYAYPQLDEYGLELFGIEDNSLQLVLTDSKKFKKELSNLLERWNNG